MSNANYFKKFSNNRNEELDFMEHCDKDSLKNVLNQKVTIDGYGISRNSEGIYAIIHLAETPDKFYFGGMAVTNKLAEIDDDGMHEALKSEKVMFVSKQSKSSGREYLDMIVCDRFDN